MDFLNYLINNKEFFVLLGSLLGTLIPLITFLVNKSKEQKQINFNIFHDNLMKGLANRDTTTGLDQQIAILYELRNYPEYYPLIKRLLSYKVTWWETQLEKYPQFQQLINEASETLDYLSRNYFYRVLHRYK